MIRHIYIVDDDEPVRASLHALLGTRSDTMIRSFASGDAFLSSLDELEPGVVLLDPGVERRAAPSGHGRSLRHGPAQRGGEAVGVAREGDHGGRRQVAWEQHGDVAPLGQPAALLQQQRDLLEHRDTLAQQRESRLGDGSRGRPSVRSARMLRITFEVPPMIV